MPAVTFERDPSPRYSHCARCDAGDAFSSGTVLVDGRRHALYSLSWHIALGEGELLLTLGSFHHPVYADQATFGGAIRITNTSEVECELVDADEWIADVRMAAFGRALTRDEARAHDRVQDFWYYVHWLVANDPVLLEHASGGAAGA